MTRQDVYTEVTDRIIAALEEGTVPWRKPWRTREYGGPVSITGRSYRGINVFLLELAGYGDPRWGTYKAMAAAGGQVRKGEKGTRIILWKPTKSKADENGDRRPYLLLRDYVVFNAEQCDGLPELPVVDADYFEPCERAEAIVDGWEKRPVIVHGGGRAYYNPATDLVRMPERHDFESGSAYYCTLFHELTHATGHESRLKRLEPALFGSDPYAREELVAEMGAAMLAGVAGIEREDEQSAAYIAGWLRRLKDDRKLVIQAAAQAQKAADLILGTTFEDAPAKSDAALVAA